MKKPKASNSTRLTAARAHRPKEWGRILAKRIAEEAHRTVEDASMDLLKAQDLLKAHYKKVQ